MSLSISEIRDALGESTYSLRGLCTSSKINMWSKIKPHNTSWDYGIKMSVYASPSSALNAAKSLGSACAWSYQRPTNNYNIGSFVGYNHNAGVPFVYEPSQTEIYTGDSTTFSDSSFNADLELSDFFSSGYTFRLVYRRSDIQVASEKSELTLSSVDTIAGYDYDVAIVISNGSYYYLIPYPYFTITRASGSPVALVSCDLSDTGKGASNIVMRGIGTSRTITSIQAVWRKSMNTAWNTAGDGEADGGIIISSQTLSTNGTVLTLDSGVPAVLGVTGSDLADGYLLLRFIYVGSDGPHQQQTVLSAGGSTPIDPPTA